MNPTVYRRGKRKTIRLDESRDFVRRVIQRETYDNSRLHVKFLSVFSGSPRTLKETNRYLP